MYDSIIIGGGAAGCTASIYLSRYRLKHLIFGETAGGQIQEAHLIQNYPGFVSISGLGLARRFQKHVTSYHQKIQAVKVVRVEQLPLPGSKGFRVVTADNQTYAARTFVLAMGARHRSLNIPNENQFLGKGVSYCAACDAPLFKNKTVAVVGGHDAAVEAALLLIRYAKQVYLIYPQKDLKISPSLARKMSKTDLVQALAENHIHGIRGTSKVERVILGKPFQKKTELKLDGIFVEIGYLPASSLAHQLNIKMTPDNLILIKPNMSTSVEGVFACGELAYLKGSLKLRQIITSAAQGAQAAAGVYHYLTNQAPAPSWN